MYPNYCFNCMMPCQRAVPIMPGSFPSSFPAATGTPINMYEGEDMMADEMMQGTEMGPTSGGAGMTPGTGMGTGVTPGTGMTPGTGTTGVQSPQAPFAGSPFETAPGSPTILDTEYTQGYLRTQVGKRVLVTFLLGTGTLQDRTGVLEKVGISYIIIGEPETNRRTLCDIYSIKFVSILS